MMKPDQAREHLGTLRSAKHQQARLDRVAKLPKPLAAIGLGVFGLLPTMKPPKEWPARRKLEAQSAAKLDADPKGRAKWAWVRQAARRSPCASRLQWCWRIAFRPEISWSSPVAREVSPPSAPVRSPRRAGSRCCSSADRRLPLLSRNGCRVRSMKRR